MSQVFITFLASFLVWFMFLGLFIMWVVDGRIKKEQVLHALFASLLVWLITQIVKSIFPTIRPFFLDGVSPMTVTIPGDGAFPSSHSAVAFALAISIWLHEKKLGLFYLFLAFLVGVGRVLARVHYPLDIMVGAILGILVALLVERFHFFKMLKKSIKLDS
jgi:undecaprenyl-diphosphatase